MLIYTPSCLYLYVRSSKDIKVSFGVDIYAMEVY